MKYLFFLAFTLSMISCRTVKMDTPETAQKLAEFSKSACYGDCPAYHIVITTDGTVTYTGKRNVEKMGVYNRSLTKKDYSKLVKSLQKADLYQYDEIYNEEIQDGSVTRIVYNGEKGKKQIATKYSFPGDLAAISKQLEDIATTSTGWIQITKDNNTEDKKKDSILDSEEPVNTTKRVVSYAQGACFGSCPVFSIEILSDKSMIMVGQRFVDKLGIYENKLSDEQYETIIALFRTDEFKSLEAQYDEDLMDAQQFEIQYFDKNSVMKSVKTKITMTENLQKIIDYMQALPEAKGWKKKESGQASKLPSETILVSLNPKVNAKTWIKTKEHLGLDILRFLSPNGTYFIVTYDESLDMNRVMEELSRDRDVLNVSPGDRPSKPRNEVNPGTSDKKGKANLGGN